MPKLDEFIEERAKTLALLSGYEDNDVKQGYFADLAEKAMRDAIAVAQSEDKDG